jgi:hypothetical protein
MSTPPLASEIPDDTTEAEGIPPDVADASATFVNGFYVSVSGGFTRIAFAEVLDGNAPRYRWAVVLPTSDARDLASVLFDVTAAAEASEETTEGG